ncbi:hypothetical protein [Nocardioides jejuensis]|uniref:Uncharacterized protein n=1 Tax=Nocardioides jejuensis TaxID=2502782 RepID=A0A4V2NXX8_9ACTN|nr:hypothetical protein [Nocardioides jejuensis]TCJ23032.1 hypothetical protein EPD65_11765 [Nocardioides jejuensis]
MARSVYDTAFHRAQRKAWAPIVEAGDTECTELRCLMPDRTINPGTPWQLAHDRRVCIWPRHHCTSDCYLGPAHQRCNTSEGATHGNTGGVKRWRL